MDRTATTSALIVVGMTLLIVSAHAEANASAPADGAKCPTETVRNAPIFPPACMGVEGENHQVTAYFDIDEAGRPVNVEIRDFTDACFVDVSEAAVREWRYSCEFAGATGKQTLLKFEKVAPVRAEQPGAASPPILRVPPMFPSKCQRYKGTNTVKVVFDIDESGATRNVRAVEYTEKCFIKSAEESVRQWRYEERDEVREGVETVVTFMLMD